MSAKNDSIGKTLGVAVGLCLLCSLIVSGAAVVLKPEQQANKLADVQKSILLASGLVKSGEKVDIAALFAEKVESKLVDLESGEFVSGVDAINFNQRAAAKDPKQNIKIAKDVDLGNIKQRSKLAKVYLIKENQELKSIVLPVHGKGLFSTLYGFIALNADTTTISGLKFYEHGETPGLGGEIENPLWIAKWEGKNALSSDFKPNVSLVKTGAKASNEVDALSGASYTSNGVENLLNYWLGDNGFGPFLAKVRGGQHGV